jgi:hypothetical protein
MKRPFGNPWLSILVGATLIGITVALGRLEYPFVPETPRGVGIVLVALGAWSIATGKPVSCNRPASDTFTGQDDAKKCL